MSTLPLPRKVSADDHAYNMLDISKQKLFQLFLIWNHLFLP